MTDPPRLAVRFVGLVADDLTGANDAAVQFAAAGWDVRTVRRLGDLDDLVLPEDHPVLVAVTTATRASSDDEAARRTAAAVDALVRAGSDRLFLKIDSTVRGSIAGQITGALTAWEARYPAAIAVICPAYPDHGRTVSGAQVLVDGVPVAESPAAADPVTPVTVSALDQLIPGSVSVRADAVAGQVPSRRIVVDAATNDDLALISLTIDRVGPRAIAVGAAGLAQAMAARWFAPPAHPPLPYPTGQRILVAVSSLHQASHQQIERLLETVPGAARAPARAEPHPNAADLVVIATQAARAPWEQGSSSASLARRVAAELRQHPYDAMVLIGGDGALAVLDLLGATQLKILGEISAGAPLGIVIGGVADGLPVVTRSGGFGDAGALIDIIRRVRGEPLAPPAAPGTVSTEQKEQP